MFKKLSTWASSSSYLCEGKAVPYSSNPNHKNRHTEMDLVHALERAASAIPSIRQAGEAEIKTLELQKGFYVALLSVYIDDSLPNSSRSLAVIYLKNAVERKWRRGDAFNSDEKETIRRNILKYVLAPATWASTQLSKQLAMVVATIARTDFPRLWPELLSELNQMVIDMANQGKTSELNSTLEVMHQTLKKLSTARIGPARVQLNEFSVTNIELYWRLFTTFGSYQALKIVGTLLYGGHDRAHRFPGPQVVFHELLSLLQNFNYVTRVGKIYERLLDRSPLVFCGFGADSAAVSRFYCDFLNQKPSTGPILQAMCIVRDLTRLVKSSDLLETSLQLNLRPRDDQDRQDLQTAYAMCSSVFDKKLILELTVTLISFFFQMTEEDVELWRDDPSEFVVEESRQNPEFSVVLCAEMLFAHLLKAWPKEVTPKAQELIEAAVHSGQDLAVEAALRALQFGSATFVKSFNVDPIIRLLAPNNSPMVRRRLCLVAGGWMPVASDGPNLQFLSFELVKSTLIDHQWDIVVQLGALDLAQICCDDIDFKPECFQIAADAVFSSIYRLLQHPNQTSEVKLHVLRVLGTVIEGVDMNLSDQDVERILEILPALWEAELEHSNHHLIQGAVLQTLAYLVSAKGSQSLRCYEVSIPLCQIATDPTQPISSYLLEDGLNLWKSLLLNIPSGASYTVSPMFERLVDLIESRTEYLSVLLTVLESFLWLDYETAMPYLDKLFGMFSSYLGDGLALDEAVLILLCLEVLMITSFHSNDSLTVITSMNRSGLMQWMSSQIIRAGTPDTDADMDTMILASKCMNVVSFVAIKSEGQAIEQIEILFPAWLSRVSGAADPRDRKLLSMGLSALLNSLPQLFEAFAVPYVRSLSLCLEDVPDTLTLDNPDIVYENDNNRLTEEEKRKKLVRATEFPVKVGLQAYVYQVAQSLQLKGFPDMGKLCVQMGVLS